MVRVERGGRDKGGVGFEKCRLGELGVEEMKEEVKGGELVK